MSSTTPRHFHGHEYEALIPFITENLADTPFTPLDLIQKAHGKLLVPSGDGAAKPMVLDPDEVLDRISYLASLAVYSARPRTRETLAHRYAPAKKFVTEGAFYRTLEGSYVWDTGARWWYDDRTDDARLWGNALPHDPTVTTVTIAAVGNSPRRKPKDPKNGSMPRSVKPLSKLPRDVVKPPALVKPSVPTEVATEAPEAPPAPAEPPVVITGVEPSTGNLTWVSWEHQQAAGVPGPEVLSNDGAEGGTLVVKVDGKVIVATIKAVA